MSDERMHSGSGPGGAERAAVERYFGAINARDVGAIVADLADAAEWSWPGSGEVIRGRATIEAVVGARVPVVTLEGVQWLTVPPNTPPGREFRIVGHGLPLGTHQPDLGKRGALRVQVYIDMPTELTASQAAAVLALEAQLGAQHFARAMTYRAALAIPATENPS